VKKLVMMALLVAGTMTLSLARMTPAAAQVPGQTTETGPALNLMGEGVHRKTDVEVNQERDRESAYKSGMSKIPDKKVKNDPWGAVRSTPPTASATK
jgi:hypothetical protein